MDVVKGLRDYFSKMVRDVQGMKALLVDKDTIQYIGMVFTQSEILQKEVYFVDRIENKERENMLHLKALVLIRPTAESVSNLIEELKHPKFAQYSLYFSNFVKESQLARIAEADEHELVKEVQEMYCDYLAVNPNLFSLGLTGCILSGSKDIWEDSIFMRTLEGLTAALLSVRKRPVIRYAKMSGLAKKLASEMNNLMQQEGQLFHFGKQDVPPLLLILDRRDDPVTPILNQWTYQSMVHDLLGIYNNRVDLSKVADAKADGKQDSKEIILNPEQDDFFKRNMYNNFGEIGANIKELVEDFQSKTQQHKKLDTIQDMKNFIENYPQFKQMSGTVFKHVTVVGELSRLVEQHDLLTISEVEQRLAVESVEHQSALQDVRSVISNPRVTSLDAVRSVLLYALRFQKNTSSTLPGLVEMLTRRGVEPDYLSIVSGITQYSGYEMRESDLFSNRSIISMTKKTLKGLKGVENIYTQHEPNLADILDQLSKGKLKDTSYPFAGQALRDRPQDVIVFIIGGATFAEARVVDRVNKSAVGLRVLLGGTNVHNAFSFMEEVEKCLYGNQKSIFVERKLRAPAPPPASKIAAGKPKRN